MSWISSSSELALLAWRLGARHSKALSAASSSATLVPSEFSGGHRASVGVADHHARPTAVAFVAYQTQSS